MRKHGLYVMTLEEYEPNREFVGRNFNAGEVIQLVLRSPRSGRWLPFEYVQMVMMHELAHCKQMNHSRAFWAVRNGYAAEMHTLWRDGYRGEGIWGRGASLGTGEWARDAVRPDEEPLPEHMCGGTYRSRGRKRKTKPTLTYQERKERRILKKFGKNGVALGADEEAKVRLEKGKRIQAKPRVAGSARGRELRAAAALARFEQQKDDKTALKKEDEDGEETESGSESEYEDADAGDLDSKDAVDVDGSRLTDSKGRGMVRVCEDEDADDPDARNELDELRDVFKHAKIKRESPEPTTTDLQAPSHHEHKDRGQQSITSGRGVKDEPEEEQTSIGSLRRIPPRVADSAAKGIKPETPTHQARGDASPIRRQGSPGGADLVSTSTCSMCSFANPELAVTCGMCANVLNPASSRGAWRCRKSSSCVASSYVNSGDCGVCGLCGQRRANDS
ncbi:wlm domain-containing protein [Purpureocillium lavendulum]|uniref:Wlm domain-containing protein n=1 Tax=Purpureocillium lavendulum TaxID=1247861 RepID=A0AB34G2Z0_9HYPO|nr:wlm domain-containing protein [Purpureocillium lavendulum]